MALIQCSECGKEVSDKAEACLGCGNPQSRFSQKSDSKESKKYYDDKGNERQPWDWELKKEGIVPPKKPVPFIVILLGVLVGVMILGSIQLHIKENGWGLASENDSKSPVELADEKLARKMADARRRKAEKEGAIEFDGSHCLSAWDGSNSSLNRLVKENLKNPKSFEHIETRITPKSDSGDHVLLMKYRAENSFGGMTIGSAMASVRNSDCSLTIISYE